MLTHRVARQPLRRSLVTPRRVAIPAAALRTPRAQAPPGAAGALARRGLLWCVAAGIVGALVIAGALIELWPTGDSQAPTAVAVAPLPQTRPSTTPPATVPAIRETAVELQRAAPPVPTTPPAAPVAVCDTAPALPLLAAGPACSSENYGTSVAFLGSPAEAGKQAERDQKLVFLLHISGNFEDSQFT
jgi:hypothetical protein